MKTSRLFALPLALTPLLWLPAAARAQAPCDVTVNLPNYAPASLVVAPGTTVDWCWETGNHSVTGTGFDSGVKNADATYQRAFPSTGTFAYHCTVHPSTMQGSIVVRQPSASPSSTSPSPARTTTPPPTTARTTTTAPAPVATTPPPTVRPTTASPTRSPTPSPTTPPPTAPETPTPEPTTDPSEIADILPAPPAKPRPGLAIALGLVVAVASLGGAAWLLLRGRNAA